LAEYCKDFQALQSVNPIAVRFIRHLLAIAGFHTAMANGFAIAPTKAAAPTKRLNDRRFAIEPTSMLRERARRLRR
jgi:hypothetical protein